MDAKNLIILQDSELYYSAQNFHPINHHIALQMDSELEIPIKILDTVDHPPNRLSNKVYEKTYREFKYNRDYQISQYERTHEKADIIDKFSFQLTYKYRQVVEYVDSYGNCWKVEWGINNPFQMRIKRVDGEILKAKSDYYRLMNKYGKVKNLNK